jgi:hypothetical protein
MGSDTTRRDGVQRGESADVNRKGAELVRPAVLDLKQEADLNVEPFSFKPRQSFSSRVSLTRRAWRTSISWVV